jgi:cytoskeletal protein CcmA (bactofilin family)
MFGPRKDNENEAQDNNATTASPPAQAPRAAASPAVARRVVEMPGSNRRMDAKDAKVNEADKKLIVGKGLSLAGEITSCDILVVEGKVEAKLTEGKLLEIAEAGQFRGSVEIENADIAGRYDGQLIVHGRLTVRSTGRISGMVKYGELEVNAGGQIIGEVQVVGTAQAAGSNGFKSAAKFASDDDKQEQRKAS